MDEQAWCEPGGELASSGQYCFSGELGRRKLVFLWLSIKKPDLHDICFLFLKLCFEPVTSYKLLLFFFFLLDCFLSCKHRIQQIFLLNVVVSS